MYREGELLSVKRSLSQDFCGGQSTNGSEREREPVRVESYAAGWWPAGGWVALREHFRHSSR